MNDRFLFVSPNRQDGAQLGSAVDGTPLNRNEYPVKLVGENVSKHFAGLRAVDGVSLAVMRGEILGLIGPNGSGKTTLINVLSGILPITSGRVRLGSVDVTGWPARRIAHAGLARTFQVVRLFREMTVLENVEVGAVSVQHQRRSIAQESARAALDRVGLLRYAHVYAKELPHGQGRLVEIARALATNPSFLLLDEPGAGLNESESESLLACLRRIPRDIGCGLLVVDHDMRLIMRLCDRIHVLDHGRTIADGEPSVVRKVPAVRQAYLGTEAT